ncbi:MAG: CocE/NonD family hydrolase [Candidatus Competibacterales bacterium]
MTSTPSALRPVREIDHLWIPLSDGVRLAARIWLPTDADAQPVPAILEYLPYRKRDGTAARDEISLPHLASCGYACVRVDIRGNGESEGLMFDEYTPQELSDGLEVIRWLAEQPWCSGKVGVWGISWGGFNGLQLAYLQPPALGAVITLCSTDDRYVDDIHYKGGCLLTDNFFWAGTMLSYSSRPPDPALVGDSWRDVWRERLENMPLLAENWLRHPLRDDFWRHGSVGEDFSRIQVPVMAVGGWVDAYSNAIPRLLQGLTTPRTGLIGPWAHKYPHIAYPEPAMDFLTLARRFWDRWLADLDNGAEADGLLTVYIQDSVPPAADYDHRPGRWVTADRWPPREVTVHPLTLGAHTLGLPAPSKALAPDAGRVDPTTALTVCSPQTVGLAGGRFCPIWRGPQLPTDQREDDAGSLCFDSAPLDEPLEILGAPVAHLTLSVDHPVAFVAVRLCDVAPSGASTRVSYGVLNLTHREGHTRAVPLEPGERYGVAVALDDIGHRFAQGHRLRLAVSTTYWPMVWPSPSPVTLTVYPKDSHLALPVRTPPPGEVSPTFDPPLRLPGLKSQTLRSPSSQRRIERDVASGAVLVVSDDDFGAERLVDIDLEVGSTLCERFTIHPNDPLCARHEFHKTQHLARGSWEFQTIARGAMWADGEHFYLDVTLEAYENRRRVWRQPWQRQIPREGL